jgi:hypothetical protein
MATTIFLLIILCRSLWMLVINGPQHTKIPLITIKLVMNVNAQKLLPNVVGKN